MTEAEGKKPTASKTGFVTSLSMKMWAVGLVATVVIAIVTVVSLVSLQSFRSTVREYDAHISQTEQVLTLEAEWREASGAVLEALAVMSSDKFTNSSQLDKDYFSRIQMSVTHGNEVLESLEVSELDSKQRDMVAQVKTSWEAGVSFLGSFQSKVSNVSGTNAGIVVEAIDEDLKAADATLMQHAKALVAEFTQEGERTYSSGERLPLTAAIIIISTLVVSGILMTLLVVFVARSVKRPALAMRETLNKLSEGDLVHRVEKTSNDEIGHMAPQYNQTAEVLRQTLSEVSGISQEAVEETTALAEHSDMIAQAAVGAGKQSVAVAAAAEQVSRNVQTVAAGAEEMGASIREISSNANAASDVAAEATRVAVRTNETVAKLGESSQEIGAVIETITAVAEQTNLLALNATIEAARAGDAGRGFAVVASEVKDLAAETAQATGDIAQRIEQIQADISESVTAIEEISDIIASINDYQTTIAAAVEEQTATTAEMSRSVQEAATGATEIAHNISNIAQDTEKNAVRLGDISSDMRDTASAGVTLQNHISELSL
ncbi:MAG: methyl-accepting chemotaxis protein [Actinomycetaceae bacterium]|nr:methyl-accepting chemotaxis protein [Actinomycetaceae bacterium]